ncbi:DUF2231 domain-containing protein [Sphingomonas tabacisoli]|uniref:DUF2231 domain-containing protein n=1 Tax=Sphingomonas tabacisoli TaxID=2249466 RepID=A0ABW4HXT7_9SPHN
MDEDHPRSTAKIAGHPIHPMVVMFPIVLFIASWVCDLLYWHSRDLTWATFGLITLGLGIVTAAIAAIFGMIDYFGDERVRAIPAATKHFGANVAVVLIEIGSFAWRMSGGPDYVMRMGLVLSTVAVVLLGYSGWKGATLVYEYGVGVDSRRGHGQSR